MLVGLTSTGGQSGGGTAFNINTTGSSFAVNHKFIRAGGYPNGDLLKASDGNFYGMTSRGGGATNSGTIFKISSTGSLTVIKILDNTTGSGPTGSLVEGSDGNFYGMATNGGGGGYGTIFKVSSAGVLTVLKLLQYTTSGGSPYGSLTKGTDGNFYGMTSVGGTSSGGTIFKITPTGTFTILKNLDNSTGLKPYGSLVQGSDGNFYGMTFQGGSMNRGTIFKISSTGSFTIIKNLDLYTTGGYPQGSLIKGTDGNFYGMARDGGTNSYGTIFKITTTGTLTVLKNLDNSTTGSNPVGNLTQDSDGNFYGMTSSVLTNSYGTIFKITPAGSFTVLRKLDKINDGSNPHGSLVKSSDGYFYGMTSQGGSNVTDSRIFSGVIFKISSTGNYSVLVRLPDNIQGISPQGNLIQGKDGNFFGTAQEGGKNGFGTVYKLCTSGSFTALNSFDLTSTGGSNPKGSLTQGSDGNFYGMTTNGGNYNYGTIFKISSSGTRSVLQHLNFNTTGAYPYGSLAAGNDGNFYGMTSYGGTSGSTGTIFKITSTGTLTVLRNLSSNDGYSPYGSLIKGSDGNFYGMTYTGSGTSGTIFKITPTGTFTVIKNFNSGVTGGYPYGSLVQGTDGNFYGMTNSGGTNSYGVIFKVTSTGTLTVLKNLDGTTTGRNPHGDLVQATDGAFYGLTSGGGTYNGGTVFKITSAGTFTVLRHLNPSTDGSTPLGSLIVQKANPVAGSQTVITTENTVKKIKLTGSGGMPLTYTVAVKPLHGTASILKDTLTYTPATGYSGTDSLTYYATWGCQNSAAAKVTVTVKPITTITNVKGKPINDGTFGNESWHINASPNPSPTYFTIIGRSKNNQPISLRVMDATGRTVDVLSSIALGENVRVGTNYKPGFYFVEVIHGNERVMLKLIKSH